MLGLLPPGAFAEVVHLAASWDVIMSAVASGDGVSVPMPELWQPEMAGAVNREIAGDPRPGRLVAATRRGEDRPAVLAVLDELAARTRDDVCLTPHDAELEQRVCRRH